jgi:hypothetical protein
VYPFGRVCIDTTAAFIHFGSNILLKKRDKQRLEAAQMKFLRHLLGITKLDKEKKNTNIRGKNWGTEHSKGDRTVPAKMATTCTEDGQK